MALRTKYKILNDFSRKLREIGRDDLYDLLSGEQVMEGVKKVADKVGFKKHPVDGESMKKYINELTEWILRK